MMALLNLGGLITIRGAEEVPATGVEIAEGGASSGVIVGRKDGAVFSCANVGAASLRLVPINEVAVTAFCRLLTPFRRGIVQGVLSIVFSLLIATNHK